MTLLMNRYNMFITQQNAVEAQKVIDIAGRMGYFDLKQSMLQSWSVSMNNNQENDKV